MPMELKKREGESASAFLYRFTKKMQQSGVLRESRKRKNFKREENKNKRRKSAIFRDTKKKEMIKERKMGISKFNSKSR